MRTRSDGGLVHGCEEVNTRVKEWTHDKAGYIWWSYRYGTLTTPKSSPSAERVIQPKEKLKQWRQKDVRPLKRSPLWYVPSNTCITDEDIPDQAKDPGGEAEPQDQAKDPGGGAELQEAKA